MDGLLIFHMLILGVFCSHNQISAALMEMRVRPGDNIVLYCDCKFSTGVYITWYRNCSHETKHTQLKLMRSKTNKTDPLRFFHYLRNDSSDSYDLLILNITDSDAGLYYCGTEETRVEDKEYIKWKTIYSYGRSVTRILLNTDPYPECTLFTVCVMPWMMMTLTPALITVFCLLSFILVYHIYQKRGKQPPVLHKRSGTKGPKINNQDEDVYLTHVVFWPRHGQTHHYTEDKTSRFASF